MSASRIGLDPEFAKKLSCFEIALAKQGIKVILTWGYRSISSQNQLYAKGRTASGNIVTNAYGGYSWHNYGLAADYAFVINGKVTWNGPWTSSARLRETSDWSGAATGRSSPTDLTCNAPRARRLRRCARRYRQRSLGNSRLVAWNQ